MRRLTLVLLFSLHSGLIYAQENPGASATHFRSLQELKNACIDHSAYNQAEPPKNIQLKCTYVTSDFFPEATLTAGRTFRIRRSDVLETSATSNHYVVDPYKISVRREAEREGLAGFYRRYTFETTKVLQLECPDIKEEEERLLCSEAFADTFTFRDPLYMDFVSPREEDYQKSISEIAALSKLQTDQARTCTEELDDLENEVRTKNESTLAYSVGEDPEYFLRADQLNSGRSGIHRWLKNSIAALEKKLRGGYPDTVKVTRMYETLKVDPQDLPPMRQRTQRGGYDDEDETLFPRPGQR